MLFEERIRLQCSSEVVCAKFCQIGSVLKSWIIDILEFIRNNLQSVSRQVTEHVFVGNNATTVTPSTVNSTRTNVTTPSCGRSRRVETRIVGGQVSELGKEIIPLGWLLQNGDYMFAN